MRRMYSENQIKTIAGAVATEIVEDNAPHLYEYNISDSDLSFNISLPFEIENITISYDATELSTSEKAILTKIYNYFKDIYNIYNLASYSTEFIPINAVINSKNNSIAFIFTSVDSSFDEIGSVYQFTVANDAVTGISTIVDETFEDGLNIAKIRKIF